MRHNMRDKTHHTAAMERSLKDMWASLSFPYEDAEWADFHEEYHKQRCKYTNRYKVYVPNGKFYHLDSYTMERHIGTVLQAILDSYFQQRHFYSGAIIYEELVSNPKGTRIPDT